MAVDMGKQYGDELRRLRRWLHQHPECAGEEYETNRFITEYLDALEIPWRRAREGGPENGNTGVIADLVVDETLPTLGIRAEMDGLPVEEETGLPFASQNPGQMHACGHDAIMAVTLCLANLFTQYRENLKCNIRFLFEPSEETGEGARYMMKGGALENPRPMAVLVFHFANRRKRCVEIQKNISTAVIGGMSIRIRGSSSHWSQRVQGIDAMYAASRVVMAVQDLNERFRVQYPFVLGFGRLQAGSTGNVLAGQAELSGSLRAFTEEDFRAVYHRLGTKINEIHRETGADIQISVTSKIPPIVNSPGLVKRGAWVGRRVFGERFQLREKPFLVGDNAAYYMEQVPGMRVVFQAGKEGEMAYPIHNPRFDIEERAMEDALNFLFYYCTME